jgi:hypothetical protein
MAAASPTMKGRLRSEQIALDQIAADQKKREIVSTAEE